MIVTLNLFRTASVAIRRASDKRIELRPFPQIAGFEPTVTASAPRGHYVCMDEIEAQIIAVDDYRPEPGTYADLFPGFELRSISDLPDPDNKTSGRKFVSILYHRAPTHG